MKRVFCVKIFVLFQLLSYSSFSQNLAEHKPFTRWWWMGSAVTEAGIKYNLEAFQKAGLGGVEITPIYGVKGTESAFIPFMSEKWLSMLNYTTKTADSLGLKVDMVLGTGWPYGGPQVEAEFAASRMVVDSFMLKPDEKFVRNLKHSKPDYKLIHVFSLDRNNTYQDLTNSLITSEISFQNTEGDKTLFVVYEGKTGQKVKRAAPGGDGYTVDHYSKEALSDYLEPFQEKLNAPIRAIFNDSYEVYDTDFTPHFFDEFYKRRGYDLKPLLASLIRKENSAAANRIRSDYRETLSDLLKEKFNKPWTEWAHSKGYKTKLQAHGSPGNLLDLYATADIPECETFGSMPFSINGFRREKEDIREGDADPVMLKFSSSAAHVMGKPLVSSETFTWLRDHFKTALSQAKPEVEELFLNGINHVFLHGSTYSPPEAKWPGWKFYAAVNFSPQMPIWKDANALFNYIKNCQELLQKGSSDNEIALYWPIYDVWNDYLKGSLFFQFKIHSLQEWLIQTPFYEMSNFLSKNGYSADFLSDEFIDNARFENGKIHFKGAAFKAIVVPKTQHIPLKTLQKLMDLKSQGANVYFEEKPSSVPGFNNFAAQELQVQSISKDIQSFNKEELIKALIGKEIYPENLVHSGLKFIRRDVNGTKLYYIVNHNPTDFDGIMKIQEAQQKYWIFDPQTGEKGWAKGINNNNLRVQLKSGSSLFVGSYSNEIVDAWKYQEKEGVAFTLNSPFQLTFLEGGPELPPSQLLSNLQDWTTLGSVESKFSGTAAYETVFDLPKSKAKSWLLQLPDVRESAKIFVNDKYVGTLWANPFEIRLDLLKKKKNKLRIEVTNLAANRIKAQEEAGDEWKIFYEINMVNKDYKPFDARKWDVMPSGLIGEIKLQALK